MRRAGCRISAYETPVKKTREAEEPNADTQTQSRAFRISLCFLRTQSSIAQDAEDCSQKSSKHWENGFTMQNPPANI
jgi:hypothetical protein